MTLGWYCGHDPFGPYDHANHDITRCFQSLAVLLPPSLFLLAYTLIRLTTLRRLASSPLLLDPLPRFPQVITASLAILALFYMGFFLLMDGSALDLYMIVQPGVSFVAWAAALLLLRWEHSRALGVSAGLRVFWLLAFIASLKQGESSVMSLALGNPVTAFDILVLLHLFLSSFMLRYAITGIGDQSLPSHSWQDLEAGINESAADIEEPASSAARTDRTMWKRFLNFHQNGTGAAGDDDEGSVLNHSVNSTAGGGGVFSSLDARGGEESNPFDSAANHNPFEERSAAATFNPFAAPDTANNNPFAAPAAPAPSTASASSSVSSKTKALRASLMDSHPLSGAAISIPSLQDSTVASRTIIQYQVVLRLGLPSLVTGSDATDTLTVYRRYREFEGLRDAVVVTGRKYRLAGEVRPLPEQVRRREGREEGRAGLEEWMGEVMTEPLYWDDVGNFVGVKDHLAYIDSYKQQLEQQRQQEERRRREEAELAKAEELERERQRLTGAQSKRATATLNGSGQPTTSSSMQVVKVTVERPQGLDYKWQIIAVEVSGWSRWVAEVEEAAGDGVEGEQEEGEPGEGRKASKRASKRKGAAAIPSLPAYYLTFDLPVKTTIGDYTLYKRASELIAFRATLLKQFPPASIPPLSLTKGDMGDKAEAQLAHDAKAVEVFLQSLVSTTALQCNTVYAFLERRQPRSKSLHSEQHHFSGNKPVATYTLSSGEWRAGEGSTPASKAVTPAVSGRSTPVVREEEGAGGGGAAGRRSRRATGKRVAVDVSGPSLFPDAVAAPPSPKEPDSEPSSLSTSISSGPSPLAASTSNSASNTSTSASSSAASHRFTVSIPTYALSEPSNPKSHVLYTLIVREYFTVTSFIEWRVIRRYRDFEHTHATLHKLFPAFPLPPLPAKRRVGKKRDGEVEERRAALEVWVQQLVNVTLFQVDDFFDFLDMNNANRVFSVGTATSVQARPDNGAGTGAGGGGEAGEGDGEGAGEGVLAGAGGGGRSRAAMRNGGLAGGGAARVGGGGAGGGEVSVSGRAGRQASRPQQPVTSTTNPFD